MCLQCTQFPHLPKDPNIIVTKSMQVQGSSKKIANCYFVLFTICSWSIDYAINLSYPRRGTLVGGNIWVFRTLPTSHLFSWWIDSLNVVGWWTLFLFHVVSQKIASNGLLVRVDVSSQNKFWGGHLNGWLRWAIMSSSNSS